MIRRTLVVLAVGAGVLVAAPAAQALTKVPLWQCRASPTYTSVGGNNRVEPIVANGNFNTANGASPDRAQCVNAEAGAGNLATPLGIPVQFVGAATGSAVTSITPEIGRAIDQTAGGAAKVENLTLNLGGATVILGVSAATSAATGKCVAGSTTPVLTGTSNVATLTLGGGALNLDPLVNAVNALLAPLQQVISIKTNEQVKTANSLTQRALHIVVLPSAGGAPLVDEVVAESKVAFNGPVCDPNQQGDNPGTTLGQICPAGSTYDQPRNVCIIAAGTGGSSLGEIIVGRPFQGPSGGTVIPIDVARKKYGRSACLGFSGAPKFAIVGTNKADRITGTNIADRIIGLGGNDKLDGGRGNDCIEGRTGGDNISGALGNDKLYGSTGKDHLNGGPGTDYMNAGSGNDSINAAYGKDRAIGGSGRDFINIATAGPAASIDCGAGPDKARINTNERKRVKNCEVVHVFTTGG
jgi:Ca2+-binding RTX toxin-like protein